MGRHVDIFHLRFTGGSNVSFFSSAYTLQPNRTHCTTHYSACCPLQSNRGHESSANVNSAGNI